MAVADGEALPRLSDTVFYEGVQNVADGCDGGRLSGTVFYEEGNAAGSCDVVRTIPKLVRTQP